MSICPKHKSINELFCRNCDRVICQLCVTSHKDHTIIPIHEKCVETRKAVFKYINDFDSLTKDIKFQQQVHHDCLGDLGKEHAFYRPETVLDGLVNVLSEKVREVAKSDENKGIFNILCFKFCANRETVLTKTKLNQFDQLVSEADTMGRKLREILQNSDGVLVKKSKI